MQALASRTSSMASVRLVWPFLELARRSGLADVPRQVAATLGLSQDELEHPDTRVPLQSLTSLMELAIEIAGTRDIGLIAAQLADGTHLGIGEYVARFHPTLGQALEAGQRYAALLGDGVRYGVELEGKRAYWRLWLEPELAVHEVAYEFAVALGVLSVRRIVGSEGLAPLEVHFMHQMPPDISRHRELFGCPVRFGMPVTQTVMSTRFLTTTLAGADPTLARFLERQADAMLEAVPSSSDLASRVRAVLRGERRLRDATGVAVARRLGLGVRTLARRLRDEGTGYRELLDEVRAERARQLLGHRDRSIAEAAHELGFASPQSFQRAFRRWTGTTAARYRADVTPERSPR